MHLHMFERNNILTFKVVNNENKGDLQLKEELKALNHTHKACADEYMRLAGQYNKLVVQNEELQSALTQKCKDCDSEARLKLAEKDFKELAKN